MVPFSEEVILKMLRFATKTEGATHITGDWKGQPFFLMVATGANVGLVQQYLREGGLVLTPETKMEL